MKERDLKRLEKTATVPRLLAIVTVCGLLLTVPVEQAFTKGYTWNIEVHIDNEKYEVEENGKLCIGILLTSEEGERVDYIYMVIDIKEGDTCDSIRTKIVDAINDNAQLEAKIDEKTNNIIVHVKDDFMDDNYVTIKHVDWATNITDITFKGASWYTPIPDLYLKVWDP